MQTVVIKNQKTDKKYPWIGAYKSGNIVTDLVVLFTAKNTGVCINVPVPTNAKGGEVPQDILEKVGQVSNDWKEESYVATEITLSSL